MSFKFRVYFSCHLRQLLLNRSSCTNYLINDHLQKLYKALPYLYLIDTMTGKLPLKQSVILIQQLLALYLFFLYLFYFSYSWKFIWYNAWLVSCIIYMSLFLFPLITLMECY
jgi:hypothetical protein